MHDIRYEGTHAFFNETNEYATNCFELTIQCSGAVLVELRRFGASGVRSFYSKYASRILRDSYIDDTMYGGGMMIALDKETRDTIAAAVEGLRARNDFDPSLGAGETIRSIYH